MTSTCSWYVGDHDAPWIYAVHSYDSFEAGFGNMVDLFTVMTSPIFATASDYYNINPGGNTHGHETMASLGPYYYHQSEMAIGMHAPYENQFTPVIWTNCDGGFQFDVPSVSVVVTPPVVTVGDLVTIVWGSSNANMCIFDNAPIATNGSQSFTAALVDSRPYTLECQNEWGWGSDTAVLTVNEPAPDCPAEPISINEITFIVQEGTSVPPNTIGHFDHDGTPTLNVAAYCAGHEWRLKVIGSQQNAKLDIDLANMANRDIYDEIESASCALLDEMKSSVIAKAASVNASFGGWFTEAAAHAHEIVHFQQFSAALSAGLFQSPNGFKAIIESIAIPISSASNDVDARNKLMATLEYTTVHSDYVFSVFTAMMAVNHNNPSPFIAAQQAAIAPTLAQLDDKLAACP